MAEVPKDLKTKMAKQGNHIWNINLIKKIQIN